MLKKRRKDRLIKEAAEEEARKLENSTKNVKIKSLEGHLPENYFTVGQPIYLNVTATSVDGKTYTTEGLGGSVDIDYNYDVYAHDGIIYKGNGEFEIRDLETIENDAVIFVITDKFRPELTT